MFFPKPAAWLVFASTCGAVVAQQAPPAPPAQAPAAPSPYHSAFDGYQPFKDEKVAPWKGANDTVGRIGGWRAYARQANEGDASASAPSPAAAAATGVAPGDSQPTPAAKPANPHAGHGAH